MQSCYGIDVGGSKIELVAFDAAMAERYRRRIETPTQDYAAFLQAVATLVTDADTQLDMPARSIGIGLPGVIDADSGRQLSANVPALTGHRVRHDLRQALEPGLQFGNDLQCFALSEAHGGAADGYPSMFGAILGTGAGGGYCLDGRLVTGHNGIAGEWGHWTLPGHLLLRHALPILDCPCGLRGCVERYVSGGGLAFIHRHIGGDDIDAPDVLARAAAGDATAARATGIHRDLLAHALASLVMAVDPHVIVLGGGLSKVDALYRELPRAIAGFLFRGVRVPPIVPPRFGDAGGARGAALLARPQPASR